MLVLAAALALTGCGNARTDFIEAADRICRDGGDRLVDLGDGGPAGERGIAVLTDMQRRLGALRPPAELKGDVDAYVETTRRQIDVLRRMTAASEQEAQRIARSPAATALVERRRELAERIGFDVCS